MITPPDNHRHPDYDVREFGPDYKWREIRQAFGVRYGEGEFDFHIVPAGTKTDGASVPWFFRRLVTRHGGRHAAAAVMHDHLYRHRLQPRDVCDQHFRQAMIYNGAWPLLAWAMWAAVRIGGGSHY